ncbi:hypothetical protein [Novosphingobium sp. CECT 9465]|uniref:hypothetical protein n=1 Tax=Novosphingobium sp. CECT 9465 TaxID=2829794 RepID=UPI001E2913D8|nr:hypothetical protein [Novosphingobium sp. CECT 9465]
MKLYGINAHLAANYPNLQHLHMSSAALRLQKTASRAQGMMFGKPNITHRRLRSAIPRLQWELIGLRDSALPLSAAVTAKPLLNVGRIICSSAPITIVVAVAVAL